jgi:hypothetical protein
MVIIPVAGPVRNVEILYSFSFSRKCTCSDAFPLFLESCYITASSLVAANLKIQALEINRRLICPLIFQLCYAES